MQVTQKEISPLHLQLQIHITPEDYKDKLDQELRKYRSKANLRGFRKGMAPLDVIKKMAGKPIIAEVINELVSEAFTSYLKDNKLDIFLEPLPVEEVEQKNRYSATQLNDFNFEFEIGIKPEFEVSGISQEDSYTEYEIEISDDQIDKEVEHFRKDRGKREDADEIRDENDFIVLNAVELDGSEIKEGGISAQFSILLADCKHDSVKQEFTGKKIGESIDIDIFELEDLDEDIENDFDKFLMNLKWITIKEQLLDKYGIEVNEKEVENQIVNETYQLMVRYGIFDQNRFREIISNRMKNSKEIQKVADKILTNKLMNQIYTEVTKISTSIRLDDFNEKYKAMVDLINKL